MSKFLVPIAIALSFSVPVVAADDTCNNLLSGTRAQLVKFDPQNYQFNGLTPEGLTALKKARDVIRERARLFENEFRNLTTVSHAGIVARLFKGNMFLYGPPGGAKSAYVNWLMKGEEELPFKLQLHQMITEQAFTGGQNFEAAKEGTYKINTKGSLADYTLALIDEAEKGNPAALSSLLSLLNEREILAGNQVIKARLETLFATSNANLPEIFQQFLENGQGSTAAALLNRFQFKAFVYNWLSPTDQAILDQRKQRRRYLKSLAETQPEVLQDEVFLEPKPLDWVALRQLAHTMFTPSPLFMTVYRDFVNDMRDQTNRAIRESEERHQQNHIDEPFVYFPSADYTERLRQQIPEIILMSAFVDFMLSPLADDTSLTQITQKQIMLDPLSLWRGSLAMTTLGPGNARLKFDPSGEQKIDIDFNWSIDPSSARDKREELLIKNLKDEQERFRRTFLKHLAVVQSQIELRARNAVQKGHVLNLEDTSFELLMTQNSEE
ncbi:MAG: hypothetical protein A2Z20_10695 [Bdellovibrionales bacterium RBG_16_40_8]|nr:MAG: hypothetical protein A2Z20_10695 [Bdellovibrionales bacterium RBG_16_40_8]